MATYNGGCYIREQLESFSTQTRLPDELIVVDDCSSDNTLKVLEEYVRIAPFVVKIFSNEQNIGYINNFSKTLSLCTGDIVCLSDQDDVWLPNKLAQLASCFSANPEIELVAHDIAYCKADLTLIGQTKFERMQGIFDLNISYVVGMATAIRVEFLRYCLPIPNCRGMTHDKWIHSCANILGVKILINDVLALHRRHDANVTSGEILNVDFPTSGDHFKRPRSTLAERMERMRCDIASNGNESAALLAWLTRNKDSFVNAGYDEPKSLEDRIAQLRKRLEAETLRGRILTGSRNSALVDIIKLYRCGGYAIFRGWKSLVGDVIFRCILRY